mmetsp:Transcript_23966/g.58733  ORF Transcript_23966/g.58733 Transcript_23966/m.58733 type:complete len:412 (-) Transcript_23966:868-2103(-)
MAAQAAAAGAGVFGVAVDDDGILGDHDVLCQALLELGIEAGPVRLHLRQGLALHAQLGLHRKVHLGEDDVRGVDVGAQVGGDGFLHLVLALLVHLAHALELHRRLDFLFVGVLDSEEVHLLLERGTGFRGGLLLARLHHIPQVLAVLFSGHRLEQRRHHALLIEHVVTLARAGGRRVQRRLERHVHGGRALLGGAGDLGGHQHGHERAVVRLALVVLVVLAHLAVRVRGARRLVQAGALRSGHKELLERVGISHVLHHQTQIVRGRQLARLLGVPRARGGGLVDVAVRVVHARVDAGAVVRGVGALLLGGGHVREEVLADQGLDGVGGDVAVHVLCLPLTLAVGLALRGGGGDLLVAPSSGGVVVSFIITGVVASSVAAVAGVSGVATAPAAGVGHVAAAVGLGPVDVFRL